MDILYYTFHRMVAFHKGSKNFTRFIALHLRMQKEKKYHVIYK